MASTGVDGLQSDELFPAYTSKELEPMGDGCGVERGKVLRNRANQLGRHMGSALNRCVVPPMRLCRSAS